MTWNEDGPARGTDAVVRPQRRSNKLATALPALADEHHRATVGTRLFGHYRVDSLHCGSLEGWIHAGITPRP
jgi:hypothetical protein